MITIIKNKEGKGLTFQTQQYETGLYVIINDRPDSQYCVNKTEEKYHKGLIKTAVTIGDTVTYTPYPEVLVRALKKKAKKEDT